PLLAVNVCVESSLFFTVTLAPAFTCSVDGENLKFLIVTVLALLFDGADAPATPPATSAPVASRAATTTPRRRIRDTKLSFRRSLLPLQAQIGTQEVAPRLDTRHRPVRSHVQRVLLDRTHHEFGGLVGGDVLVGDTPHPCDEALQLRGIELTRIDRQ